MPTIYCYEVEFRLTNPNTKEARSVTRTEHAYSVMDAVLQANMVVAASAGSSTIELMRVGPPLSDVAQANDVAALIDTAMARAIGRDKAKRRR